MSAAELGVCDAHDHLFFRSAQLAGQELDDVDAAVAELRAFAALGGQAVVQWTPFGLGRRADLLAGVSRAGGVTVIAATGLHQAAHYGDQAMVRDVLPRLAGLFTEELTTGMRPDPGTAGDAGIGLPRAGLIKVAGNFHHLDAHARQTMIAAAEAHHATGAPIGVHHELGTAASDVAELLCGQLQVPADKVILGHLNRQPDAYQQRQAAETGAFLAFDGPSRANHATDWRLHECLADLVGTATRTRSLSAATPPRPRPGPRPAAAPACPTCSGCCGRGWRPNSVRRWRRSSSPGTRPAPSAGPEAGRVDLGPRPERARLGAGDVADVRREPDRGRLGQVRLDVPVAGRGHDHHHEGDREHQHPGGSGQARPGGPLPAYHGRHLSYPVSLISLCSPYLYGRNQAAKNTTVRAPGSHRGLPPGR